MDGSIAELPMYFVHPHRILHQAAGSDSWQAIGRGNAHLLGRLCMEHDVVATNVALPEGATVAWIFETAAASSTQIRHVRKAEDTLEDIFLRATKDADAA